MEQLKTDVTLSQAEKHDAHLYIKKLHCNCCNKDAGFYLVDYSPYCEHCDNPLEPTQEDYESVANRGKRDPILRFKNPIGAK